VNIIIKLSKSEKKLAESYAKDKGMALSEAIKKVYFDAIEDEFDIAIANKALKEYKKDNKTISLDEMEKNLRL